MLNPNPLEFIDLAKRFFLSSSKWHLVPKDRDVTTLETLRGVLGRLSAFTDALSGEKHITASPLMWKILSSLDDEDSESILAAAMRGSIKENLLQRSDEGESELLLNAATYLHHSFKNSYVALEADGKGFCTK